MPETVTIQALSRRKCAGHIAAAWAVHALTMTGVLWAGMATLALIRGSLQEMWMWLAIAMMVDGIDGTLARRADVKRWAPNFDGAALDLIVDYLTWTFIPAVFIYMHVPMGPEWLEMAIFVVICVSSMFCYCNVAMKSDDNYFMGFPAAWNIVAVIMWILGTGPAVNLSVTLLLAALTLAPLAFVHPFRVGTLMPVNIGATVVWVASTGWLVVIHPARPTWLLAVWGISGGWLLLISAWRSTRALVRGKLREKLRYSAS